LFEEIDAPVNNVFTTPTVSREKRTLLWSNQGEELLLLKLRGDAFVEAGYFSPPLTSPSV
jgi:hypothetical protein